MKGNETVKAKGLAYICLFVESHGMHTKKHFSQVFNRPSQAHLDWM